MGNCATTRYDMHGLGQKRILWHCGWFVGVVVAIKVVIACHSNEFGVGVHATFAVARGQSCVGTQHANVDACGLHQHITAARYGSRGWIRPRWTGMTWVARCCFTHDTHSRLITQSEHTDDWHEAHVAGTRVDVHDLAHDTQLDAYGVYSKSHHIHPYS